MTAGVDKLLAYKNLIPRGIPITNARGAFSDSLAEYCVAAILYFNKQIGRLAENKAQKRWEKFRMDIVRGKTVGFLGYGSIAQSTARLVHQFGMRVIACKRTVAHDENKNLASQIYSSSIESDVDEFLKQSDYIVCSLPSTALTRHFCDTKFFAKMKPTCVFISVGRGEVVDETALAEALQRGIIRGAALDVFETEPLPSDSPLWDFDNCLISSHNADWTETYLEDSVEVFLRNLKSFIDGGDLENVVDRDAGY